MTRCCKCKIRIVSHIWWKGGKPFCSPGCERGAKSQFDKLWKQLEKMGVDARVDGCYNLKHKQY